MSLTSFPFFYFFLVSLVVYYVIPQHVRWAALLVFSILFFLFSSTPYTFIYVLVSVVATAFCAKCIGKAKVEKQEKKAKLALTVGIIVNAGILVLLKYSGFLISNLNLVFSLVHLSVQLPALQLAAPLGVSFYTFSVMGYLLDTYWGITEPQQSVLKTALFVGYYPQLTSGPITRYNLNRGGLQGLYEGRAFDFETMTFGIQRILWGVFKKLVISARLSVLVDTIYGNTTVYNGFYIWIAAALFMLQLYTDFSGCMDIILGVSECYGVTLPENFRTPFFSRSVQEFWQRWHMTLGAWLKDYILYPVLRSRAWRSMTKWIKVHWGKKAAKQIPSILGMLCVWLFMGLWHGGKWKFILGMGVWFWFLIAAAQVLEPIFKRLIAVLHINTNCFSWRLFQSLRVFVLVAIGNMFFRLDGFMITLRTIKAGFHWNPEILLDGSLFNLGLDARQFFAMLFGLFLLTVVSWLKEKGINVRKWLSEQNLAFQCIAILTLACLVFIIGMYGTYSEQDFMYQKF